jgi:hypothetical protein
LEAGNKEGIGNGRWENLVEGERLDLGEDLGVMRALLGYLRPRGASQLLSVDDYRLGLVI